MTEQKIKLKNLPPREIKNAKLDDLVKLEVKLPNKTPKVASSMYRRTSPDHQSQIMSQKNIR